MSKGSLFWGNASGRLGQSVFYRSGGEQRNRTYVKNVKNPKTIAQMTNRLRMLNPMSIFAGAKNLLATSFTNRTSAQSSYNVFMKENKTAQKYFITKDMKNQAICVPFGAKLASGSLGLDLQPVGRYAGTDGPGTPGKWGYALECLFDAKKFQFDSNGANGTSRYEVPESDLVKAIRAMAKVTLPTKFTLVFVQGVPTEFESADEEIRTAWKMAFGVLSVDGDSFNWSVYGCSENTLKPSLYLTKESGTFDGSLTTADFVAFGVNITPEDTIKTPMGIILSFVEDGVLKVSNSTMSNDTRNIGGESVRGIVTPYLEGGAVYRLAMSEYGYSTGSILNAESLAAEPTEPEEEDPDHSDEEEP